MARLGLNVDHIATVRQARGGADPDPVTAAATQEMVRIALTVKPEQVTLVPEKRLELTTEGGLDVIVNIKQITDTIKRLKDGGIVVSLFVDPNQEQIKAAKKTDTDYIEIHTGAYAEAVTWDENRHELEKIDTAIKLARKVGLGVNAGHGLNYGNIKAITALGGIEEYNIGHSIIARAMLVGLDRAVRDMVELLKYA
jgi:pyridoxine 5-phosphate synthase